jgi:hypothetical protein
MLVPGIANLRVNRWTPNKITIDLVGYDLTGGTFAQQVRSYRDAPGSAIISLTNATAGTQGISVAVVTTGGIPTSTLTLQYDEATIEGALAYPASGVKAGSDVVVYHDLHVTGGVLPKTRLIEGTFTIAAGVTQ